MHKFFFIIFCLILNNNIVSQANHWSKLPFELNRTPRFFYIDSFYNKMIIGGEFNKVDTVRVDIFIWDSLGQSYLDANNLLPWPTLTALRIDSINMLVGGFKGLYNVSNTTWIRSDSNFKTSVIYSLYNFNNEILMGGMFIDFKNKFSSLCHLVNNKWVPYNGLDSIIDPSSNYIYSIIKFQDQLYVAGNIDPSVSLFKEIIRWDGSKWRDVGGGIQGGGTDAVGKMIVYKNELYVAGTFLRSNGAIDNNIQRWDGSKWKQVGGGVFGSGISDMIVFNNELWVVGLFTSAGGIPAHNIAKWDGTTWCGLGDDFNFAALSAIGVYKNELYIGGNFTTINNDSSFRCMAKWKGGNYQDTCGYINYSGFNYRLNKSGINIYPNPIDDFLTIEFEPNQNYNQINFIKVYNSIGQLQLIHLEKIGNGSYKADLSKLKAGILICEVDIDDKSVRKKIIKK